MAGRGLKKLHLADLHERAREAGVEGFRMLTRDELIEAIERGDGEDTQPDSSAEPRDRSREKDEKPVSRRGRGRPEHEPADEVETEEVTGVLDRMPQGYGFLRLSGLSAADGDVYVSASQIRRCELRPGDEVSGPAREPRRDERHRALVRVGAVNGQEPESERVKFEDLTAEDPHRSLPVDELDEPLAFGQRVLLLAEPDSGHSAHLRTIATAAAGADAWLRVLLDDERGKEAADWELAAPEAALVAPSDDQEPSDQIRAAELAVGHAKRRAEAGADVVVIIDTLSRLALGYRDPTRVKRLFGAGRELAEEGAGSLTVIAAVIESDERGEQTREILEGSEDVVLRVNADGELGEEEGS